MEKDRVEKCLRKILTEDKSPWWCTLVRFSLLYLTNVTKFSTRGNTDREEKEKVGNKKCIIHERVKRET